MSVFDPEVTNWFRVGFTVADGYGLPFASSYLGPADDPDEAIHKAREFARETWPCAQVVHIDSVIGDQTP